MTCRRSICCCMFIAALASMSHGQVVRDNTLGNMKGATLSGPNVQINADLGLQVGNNLFHSFNQLNIQTGGSATFNGPANVSNILARVTGGLPSTIDGTLRSTIIGANFFLVNPAGVLFGPNAQIDVSGSFLATTADYLKLADGGKFSAIQPADDLLTTAKPSDFGFMRTGGGSKAITLDGSSGQQPRLTVENGRSLTLIGGEVSLVNGKLEAPAGRVTLLAVKEGEVSLDAADVNSSIDLSSVIELADSSISQGSEVNVDGKPAGRITVDARDVRIENSRLFAFNTGSGEGGGIDINASRDILIEDAQVRTFGGANPVLRSVSIDIDHTFISDLDVFLVDPSGNFVLLFSEVGGGGDNFKGQLTDDANTPVTNGSAPFNGFFRPQQGRLSDFAGKPTEGTWRLEITDFFSPDPGQLNAWSLNFGGQIGGQVFHSTDTPLVIPDPNGFGPQTVVSGLNIPMLVDLTGRAGHINIAAGNDLLVRGVSIIASNTNSLANAGDISMSAGNQLVLVGSSQFDRVTVNNATDGKGAAGLISFDAKNLFILGSTVTAETDNDGLGGNIILKAKEDIDVQFSRINSSTFGLGDGGSLAAQANRLRVFRSDLQAESSSQFALAGNAGDISLRIEDSITATSSEIISSTFNNGDGGKIIIETGTLNLLSGASIETDTQSSGIGAGNGGEIEISTLSSFFDGGRVTSLAVGRGAAGAITISTKNLGMLNEATISSSSTNAVSGPAGTITIIAEHIELNANGGTFDPNSGFTFRGEISSSTNSSSNAGSISIDTIDLLVADSFAITTSAAGLGSAGDIVINASDRVILNSLMGRDTLGAESAEIQSIASPEFGNVSSSGSITINSPVIEVLNGALITARSETAGSAGAIELKGNQRLTVSGSATKSSGDVVSTSIETLASGTGVGGDILIAFPVVEVFNGAIINAASVANDGGNITINATSLFHARNAQVTGNAFGDGGQIVIEPELPVAFSLAAPIGLLASPGFDPITGDPAVAPPQAAAVVPASQGTLFVILSSSLIDGRSGGLPVLVRIDPSAVFLTSQSQILTEAAVLPPEIDLAGELANLRSALAAPGDPLPSHCLEQIQDISSFFVGGVGGLPLSPDGWLPSVVPVETE